jgi:biotin operon repressor
MNLNEDQLKELDEMAGLFYSLEEIADNLEIDPEELEKKS